MNYSLGIHILLESIVHLTYNLFVCIEKDISIIFNVNACLIENVQTIVFLLLFLYVNLK